jgi:hypothetical protein
VIELKILLTLLIAILSGVLGRMGGAEGYNTLYRDIGCSILSILTFILWYGFNLNCWYLYLIAFGLHWASFTTYFDKLFGHDNLGFSGFVVAASLLPLISIFKVPFFIERMIALSSIWFLLNKYLPYPNVFIWRRDVAEEFLRYFSVVINYLLLLI